MPPPRRKYTTYAVNVRPFRRRRMVFIFRFYFGTRTRRAHAISTRARDDVTFDCWYTSFSLPVRPFVRLCLPACRLAPISLLVSHAAAATSAVACYNCLCCAHRRQSYLQSGTNYNKNKHTHTGITGTQQVSEKAAA